MKILRKMFLISILAFFILSPTGNAFAETIMQEGGEEIYYDPGEAGIDAGEKEINTEQPDGDIQNDNDTDQPTEMDNADINDGAEQEDSYLGGVEYAPADAEITLIEVKPYKQKGLNKFQLTVKIK